MVPRGILCNYPRPLNFDVILEGMCDKGPFKDNNCQFLYLFFREYILCIGYWIVKYDELEDLGDILIYFFYNI